MQNIIRRLSFGLRSSLLTWLKPERTSLRGYYKTTQEWAQQNRSIRTGAIPLYQQIHDRTPFQRIRPKTLETKMNWRFAGPNLPRKAAEPTFVAYLKNARIYGNQGGVITSNHHLLNDLVADQRVSPTEHPILQQEHFPPPFPLKGLVANLSGDWPENYHHWLVEILPRLELIRLAGISLSDIDIFIFNTLDQPYQEFALAQLDIPPSKIVMATPTSHYICQRLIAPSFARGSGCGIQWIYEFLRREFLPASPITAPSLRLYVSRAQARIRKVTNEAEVLNLLSRYGFQSVLLENLDFPEQVALFANAEAVVGPHGSGLTNLAFCPPQTKVIEFTMPDRVHYWGICAELGLDYYYINSFPDLPEDFTDPGWEFNQDMTVDLEILRRTLDYASLST